MKWYDISFVYNEYNSRKFNEIATNMKCTGWYQYPEEGNLHRSFQIYTDKADSITLKLVVPGLKIRGI
jgi:hypothetical protein